MRLHDEVAQARPGQHLVQTGVVGALGEPEPKRSFRDPFVRTPPDPRVEGEALAVAAAERLGLPVLGWTLPLAVAHELDDEFGAGFTGHTDVEIDLELTVARERQRQAVACHPSQAVPGSVLGGRYRLDEAIGGGSFGTVFRARHLELNRDVAVKVLATSAGTDPEALARFRREAIDDEERAGHRGVCITSAAGAVERQPVHAEIQARHPHLAVAERGTDGATEWQVFRRVTVPLLAPVLTVVFITMLINVLKVFDIVISIAPGSVQDDATVLALQMWRTAFGGSNDFGVGSAIAVFIFLLVIPILLINVRRFQREN